MNLLRLNIHTTKIAYIVLALLFPDHHFNNQETAAISNSSPQDTIQVDPANIAKVSDKNLDNQAENALKVSKDNPKITKKEPSKPRLLVNGYAKKYNPGPPVDVLLQLTTHFMHGDPLEYKEKKELPKDLSNQDLRWYDFTKCHFNGTNLTNTNLTDVILTDSTCLYLGAFNKNRRNVRQTWYSKHIYDSLNSIQQVYKTLKEDTHKAKLLHIACALSRLSFFREYDEYMVKMQYWFFELWELKKVLDKQWADKLVCPLAESFNQDIQDYCWTTSYSDEVKIEMPAPNTHFGTYLKDFKIGCKKYIHPPEEKYGAKHYWSHITKSIEGLQKVHSKIKDRELKQEGCNIAHALSKSYQVQKDRFFSHYLTCQNRLVDFKKSLHQSYKKSIDGFSYDYSREIHYGKIAYMII